MLPGLDFKVKQRAKRATLEPPMMDEALLAEPQIPSGADFVLDSMP